MASNPQKLEMKKEGKLSDIINIIKKLAIEDPLLAALFSVLIIPLAALLVPAIQQSNIETISIIIAVLIIITFFIFIPLLIIKTVRTGKKAFNDEKLTIIKAEAEHRSTIRKAEAKILHAVMKAKLEHIQIQNSFIITAMERYDKHLMVEAAKEISKSVQSSFDDIEVNSSSFIHKTQVIFEKLELNLSKIDSIQDTFRTILENLSKEKVSVPEIEVATEVKEETAYSSIQEAYALLKSATEEKDAIIADLETKIASFASSPGEEINPTTPVEEPEVTKETETPVITEEKEIDLTPVILKKIEETEIHETPIKPPEPETKPLGFWICYKCNAENNITKSRCLCGMSKVASDNCHAEATANNP